MMLNDAKHAGSFNLSNNQMINLHRQNYRARGLRIDSKERKDLSISKNDSEILSSEITNKTKNIILSSVYMPADSSLE